MSEGYKSIIVILITVVPSQQIGRFALCQHSVHIKETINQDMVTTQRFLIHYSFLKYWLQGKGLYARADSHCITCTALCWMTRATFYSWTKSMGLSNKTDSETWFKSTGHLFLFPIPVGLSFSADAFPFTATIVPFCLIYFL